MATANDILRVAAAEIGKKKENGENHIKYNIEYYGEDKASPWCVVFVWWVFKHAGASNLFLEVAKLTLRLMYTTTTVIRGAYTAHPRLAILLHVMIQLNLLLSITLQL